MKAIVCYYSWKGHTAEAGKAIAAALGAHEVAVQEVKQRRPLIGFITGGRDAMRGYCSAIRPLGVDWTAYDTVFIGSPTWASLPAPAVNSLLQDADLAGKRVYLFATSCGGDASKVFERLEERVVAKGGTVAGRFHAAVSQMKPGEIGERAAAWAATLGL
jgi:flavodoxin